MPPKSEAARLRFREGQLADQPAIEALTRGIWGGGDYLPREWPAWVAAPRSLLRVGLLDERPVVVGRLRELLPGRWWLEGMRVDPDLQGRGLASQLFDHLLALALTQPGIHELGLATAGHTTKMHHLARRGGLALICEYRFLKGPPREAAVAAVGAAEPPEQVGGRWVGLSGGYVMDGWVTRPIDETWRRGTEALVAGPAVALTGRRGGRRWLFLLTGEPSDEAVVALVRQTRHLVHHEGGSVLRTFVPRDERLESLLVAGGMHDPDEGAFTIHHYARRVGADRGPDSAGG